MPEDVTLREYLESRLEAQNKAVETAQHEMNRWKNAHNEWQKQMLEDRANFLTREEYHASHSDLSKKLDSCERLVYVGMGIGIAFQIGVGVVITLLKR